MRYKIPTLAAAVLLCLTASAQKHTCYVDPFIGTDGMGHTFPGACAPFGGVQLSPDTDTIPHNVKGVYQPRAYEYCAGYRYCDSSIVGFSHTHFSGTGHSDLGDILIMPATGDVRYNPGTATDPDSGYRSRFSHESETARPGYYEVTLQDYGVRAQLTATQRVGVHKYTFPKGSDGHLMVDLQHGIYNYEGKTLWSEIRVENDTILTGCRITSGWARNNTIYFAISFSQPVTEYGWKDLAPASYNGFWKKFNQYSNFPEMAGHKVVAWFGFDTAANPELVVKVGISAVSAEGALENLRAEAGGRSFEQIADAATEAWEKELSCIDIEGTDEQKTMFYTSLYHTMINPSVYQDIDGSYRGLDHNIHKAEGFTNYTVFSLWDTYRAEHPLLTLIKPSRERDMAMSMLAHYDQSVHHMLPIWSHMANENWCMSGYHAVSVLSDALTKGLGIPADKALGAMVSTSSAPWYCGLDEYMRLGFVPDGASSTSASNTLEYAYDDWAIWHAAVRAGRDDIAARYAERARNWRNVFDASVGLARARGASGAWREPFDPLSTSGQGFIEGNSWNFSFHVPHDVPGLIDVLDGDKAFTAKLDSLFEMTLPATFFAETEDVTEACLVGGYVHGNEPSHHIPYLYAWTSQPWKTQYWLREIMNKMYRPVRDGLGGNDDCGQMSAWYVFSALGFYPVCPGSDEYIIGAPYIPYAKVTLENGNILEIKAPGVSDKNRYVRGVRLNGEPLTGNSIRHSALLSGGTLEFTMSPKPLKKSNHEEIRNADLIFIVENPSGTDNDGMSKAIVEATGNKVENATHVGIIEVCGGFIYVIDSAPKCGTSERPMADFIEEFTHSSDIRIKIMRLKSGFDTEAVIKKAKSFIGRPYDFTFLPDNDALYCSELIQNCYTDTKGKPIFGSKPMNFKNAKGEYPEYWQSLFSKLGIPIPQDVPGTNPNDMMHDAKLKAVKVFN